MGLNYKILYETKKTERNLLEEKETLTDEEKERLKRILKELQELVDLL